MKQKSRRMLSLLLALAMCLGLISPYAWAAEVEELEPEESVTEVETEEPAEVEAPSDAEDADEATAPAENEDATESEESSEDEDAIEADSSSETEDTTESDASAEEDAANEVTETEDQTADEFDNTGIEESISEDYSDASVNDECCPNIIIKFDEISDSCISLSQHISLSELMEMMPETISVTLKGEDHSISIPITWFSEINYEQSSERYYLFWAEWDNGEYQLDPEYSIEDYIPFIEVEIGSTAKTRSVSNGVNNIVKRAYQQVEITWTPVKTIKGYINSEGKLLKTYNAGTTYHGIPYGQQVNSGKYVPDDASFNTFLNAVNNSSSVFYTSRGSYGTKNSTYYASDCSAFVSYCYGLPRMTTSTIASSSQFSKVSGNSIFNAQVGDCFNKADYHVELITGMKYDSNGTLVSVEVSEQTPPIARTVNYTPTQVQNIINNKGYTLLRFKGRDSVGSPESYQGYGGNSLDSPTIKSWSSAWENSLINLTINWNAVSGATSYEIRWRRDDGEYNDNAAITVSSGTTYTKKGLDPNHNYYFRVYAKNGTVISDRSDTINCCKRPTISSGTANSTSSITIKWGAVGNADTYTVRRKLSTESEDGYTEIKSGISGTSFEDTTVKAGTTYHYQVRAVNDKGMSRYSSRIGVSALCETPEMLSWGADGPNSATIKWKQVANAQSYEIHRNTYVNGPYEYYSTVNSSTSTFTDTGVSSGNEYGYRVYAINADGVKSAKPSSYYKVVIPYPETAKHAIDLNRLLDGTEHWELAECATADIWVNGTLVADDVSDYWAEWPEGSTYEVTDVKTKTGYRFDGIQSGSMSGVVGGGDVDLRLVFSTVYHQLDLNGTRDGNYIYSLEDCATVDVYLNGNLVADDVIDYCENLQEGTNYEFRNLKVKPGYKYEGIVEGSESGTLGGNAVLNFAFSTAKQKLNVNAVLDGVESETLTNYGFFDITINGTTYANQIDFCEYLPEGTAYTISNIRPSGIHDYIGADLAGNTENTSISYNQTISGIIGTWESYVLLHFRTNTPTAEIPSIGTNTFYARIHCGNDLYITEQGDYNVTAMTANENENQIWKFEIQDNNYYKITSVATGRAMTVQEFNYSGGPDIWTNDFTGAAKQLWAIHIREGSIIFSNVGSYGEIDAGGVIYDGAGGVCNNYNNVYLLDEMENNGNQLFSLEPALSQGEALPAPKASAKFMGHTYEMYNLLLPWNEAKRFCEDKGGHLVTITSSDENSIVTGIVPSGNSCWTGGNDMDNEGTFVWITGEPFNYSIWWEGEPNDANGGEDAVEIYSNGQWNDCFDGMTHYFICEYEPVPPVKTESYLY